MVLIAIVIMTLMATRLAERQLQMMQTGSRQLVSGQLRFLLNGAEQKGLAALERIYPLGAGITANSLGGERIFMASLAEGQASVALLSGQNCFNLNAAGNFPPGKETVPAKQALISLAGTLLNVDGRDGEALVGALSSRLSMSTGARIANVSELKLLPGFGELPVTDETLGLCAHTEKSVAVSINTLTEKDADLLAALSLGALSAKDAVELIRKRPVRGWRTVEDVNNDLNLLWPARGERFSMMLSMLTVKITHFVILTKAQYAGHELIMRSYVSYDKTSKRLQLTQRRYSFNVQRGHEESSDITP